MSRREVEVKHCKRLTHVIVVVQCLIVKIDHVREKIAIILHTIGRSGDLLCACMWYAVSMRKSWGKSISR